MGRGQPSRTSTDELLAFEVATRDLVGVALRSVGQLEVSLLQFRLLLTLHGLGRASSTQCAEALGGVGSSVTRLADRLHASGHLVRGVDPDNGSVVTLELTDSGRRVVRQVTTRRRRQLSRALDRLDPTKRAACAAVLQKLHRTLVDARADSAPGRLPLASEAGAADPAGRRLGGPRRDRPVVSQQGRPDWPDDLLRAGRVQADPHPGERPTDALGAQLQHDGVAPRRGGDGSSYTSDLLLRLAATGTESTTPTRTPYGA